MSRRKCTLHGVELVPGTMEIRYGFPPAPPPGYFEAQEKLFPNAYLWDMGGCTIKVDDDGPIDTVETVNHCFACREAQLMWEQEQKVTGFWHS
jgi:hypothetical protein